jgi:hypothetical protein
MCMSQRAMSCCLYKHRSWPIVTCPRPNQSFYFYLTFYPSFSTFPSFHRLDLLSTVSTPCVAMVLAYLSSRCLLAKGRAPSSSVGSAPDCHWNQQNRSIQFAKPDSPVSAASSSIFRFLFDSCGQHITLFIRVRNANIHRRSEEDSTHLVFKSLEVFISNLGQNSK